ncbi:MAG: hypothetical protein HY842_12240 [Bacteroidetes bacterium]|nr:hypothetical protein [Bacteroidota bacterium]
MKFQRGWRKMEDADETVLGVVFFAVQVGAAPAVRAMRHDIVMVFQKVVDFLQCNDLEEEGRQQKGGDAAICGAVFQQN